MQFYLNYELMFTIVEIEIWCYW